MRDAPLAVPPEMVVAAEAAAGAVGTCPCERLTSGASHDANHMARLCPIGLLFIPCRDGRSHCPEEWADVGHLATGTRVLLELLLASGPRPDLKPAILHSSRGAPMTESSEAKAVVVTPAALQEYARAIFVGAGAPDAVARRVAGSLVLANRSGHDSHGAIRIPQYIRDVQTGQLDPRAEPAIAREGLAWALVDGRWTFGHETARFAMAEAIRRARATGVALVSTVRTNHIGRLGEWAEQAAAARAVGIVGVAFSHAAALLVAPHQGAGRALSTNPMAIGLPRGDEPPLVLDFATSIVPEGKVRVAKEKGAVLPAGTLLDREGRATTDPQALYEGGVLLPFALHKGYALSFMIDALSIALSGADEPAARGGAGFESGAFFLAIEPTVFGSFERWTEALERLSSPGPGRSRRPGVHGGAPARRAGGPRARRPGRQPIDCAGYVGDDRRGRPGRGGPVATRPLAIVVPPRCT